MKKIITFFSLMLLAVCSFAQEEETITATWDYADSDVMSATMALSGSSESGVVDDVAKDGIQMTVLPHGAAFRNNGNNIQVRSGAELQIPVNSTDDVITVKGYPGYSYYTIGGGDEITNTNDNPTTTYSPTAAEVKQGYVSIVSTNDNNYFLTISVVQNAPSEEEPDTPSYPITATWDYGDESVMTNTMALSGSSESGLVDDVAKDGIQMTVLPHGAAFRNNGNNIQVRSGAELQIPVNSTDDVITVKGYPGYSYYTIGGGDEITNTNDNLTTTYSPTAAEVKQGYVSIVSTNDNNYFLSISVVQNAPSEEDPDTPSYPITATWNYGDSNVMEKTMALSGSSESGEVDDVAQDGIKMTVISKGATFRNNGNNIQVRKGAEFQIPVNTTDDVITVKGYPGYSYYTIGGGDEITNTNDNPTTTYSPTAKEVKQGYVSIVSTNDNNYFYSISVVLNEPKESETLEDVATTATFPFHEGTEGQTADFGEQADYFLTSKVLTGSNMSIAGKRTFSDIDWTKITPVENTTKERGENDYIDFIIQPKFGYTFTPTSIGLKVAKYGTDNGTLDIAWLNPDGSETTLATGVVPQRNNADPAYSTLTYDVEGATVAEGAVGVRVYIYGKLANNKDMDLCDIVINGLLNGEEKPVPMLDSFIANGETYTADKDFEPNGENFVATIELSKADPMISASNPIADVTPLEGEIGEISYEGDDTQCVVTIPVILDDITIYYVATFVQKADFTLTYYDTDDTVMGTQTVEKDAAIGEFAVDYTTATAEEGMTVRGWFYKKSGGQKYTVADIITADASLYAVATETEESSTYKKYTFDLTDPYFYAEDHEAFTPEGQGKWHDTTHGWEFKNGDQIALLVGPQATITVGLCKYSKEGSVIKFTDAEGNELGSVDGVSEGDGELTSFVYEGEAGTIYMNIESAGSVYIHSVKIINTSETNFESDGDWFIVKKDDASSLVEVLDYVAGLNSAGDASRKYIFLPNGTYDFGYTALTPIAGNNISIIGQSMDGVIIKNVKEVSDEGIGTTATLLNSSKNLYMQDITLKNELDFYSAGSAGRAVCFQDKGDRTIFKNVTMLSYQDTYYSQNVKQSYWETSDIHGTVDFICGGGDIRFQDCTLSLEPRKQDGSGSRTITAPTTSTNFGYVFDNCKVVDLANGAGDWNFGRTWQNQPICVYLNTVLDANAASTLIPSRWIEKGMNNTDPKQFGEYNTTDEDGNNITPASNTINSHGGVFETILTADEAAAYSYERMFTDWDPAAATVQMDAPQATYSDGVLEWEPVEGAIAYAVFINDELVDIVTEGTSLDLSVKARDYVKGRGIAPKDGDVITVRSANAMGGFGEAAEAETVIPDYEFVAAEWVAGDPGRISPDNVTVDESANTITVSQTGTNNIALVYKGKKYKVSADSRYFVIEGTGMSTDNGKSYLWWLNNKNNGSQIAPTVIYEKDGVTTFAWDLKQVSIAGTLGSEETIFENATDWSTTFGMTLADESTPAVITNIGFVTEIEEPQEETPYVFVASEWQAGDPNRISDSNVTVDEDANTITVDKDGAQNVNLQFKGDETYTVAAANKYFVIRATGTTPDGAQLWWMNNEWIGTISPEIYTDGDEILYAWPLETMKTNGGSGSPITLASDTDDAFFTYNSQWSTCFGLTLADPGTPAVISLIGFLEEIPETATSIRGINADTDATTIGSALRSGKVFDLSGRKVGNVVKGNIYIVNGKKLLVK